MFAMLHHGGQGSAVYEKFAQLDRVRFRPSPLLSKPRQLSCNAKEIYCDLVRKEYGVKNGSLLPENYLQITENRTGENHIVPIGDDDILDLEALVDGWILSTFDGEVERDGEMMESWGGDYYAAIRTDGAKLDDVRVWDSGGFCLKS